MSEPTWDFRVATWLVRKFLTAVRGIAVEGIEHLPREGKVIVAVNHVSMIDPPLVSVTVFPRRFAGWLAKREMFVPLLGRLWRRWGAIPVDRGRGDVNALKSALRVLKDGGCMVVFPEGTRSRDGKLGRAKAGVGLLARGSGAPVVPARVFRTDRLRGEGPFTVRFGPPIAYAGGDDKKDCLRFAQKVMDEISKL